MSLILSSNFSLTSKKIGLAPKYKIGLIVATKVKDETNTSSPEATPIVLRDK